MERIKDKNLAQLLLQMRFAPQKQRRKQINSAERFFKLIDKAKEYPFEFVCFHITGFRPKDESGRQIIKGQQLIDDIRIFIARLSSQNPVYVAEQTEKVYGIEELAQNCGVSTKTIHRWRKRGLLARKFIFEDGKRRFGFVRSQVERFFENNPQLTANAKNFTRLTDDQKQQIIEQAVTLAAETKLSRYRVIEQIAAKTGRSHETIRCRLLEYEKSGFGKRIFKKPSGVVNPAQAKEMYGLFKQGVSVKELMKRFNRSKSSVYRIINRRRAKLLLARKIDFIDSAEFVKEGAHERILAEQTGLKRAVAGQVLGEFKLAGSTLDKYLQRVKNTAILNRQRETELFRRYNYLKYLAFVTRAGMKPSSASSARMNKIEKSLAEAEAIKNVIIEANLYLVVNIAKKHLTAGTTLLELISDGNVSLMRAVEKFDYTRGFRFATYASWAIAKDYARKIPAEAGRFDKAKADRMEDIQQDLRIKEAADFAAIERAHKSLLQIIKDNLSEREQYIIINHFGLIGSLVRKEKKTLKQIGDDLDLSKERVRQIELIALQKLRHSLSTEEFDMLTG